LKVQKEEVNDYILLIEEDIVLGGVQGDQILEE
jgi:hypothetical protein